MGSFLLAVQFLTRIPVPFKVKYTSEKLAAGSVFFPLVGMLLGGIYYAAAVLGTLVLPSAAVAGVLIAVMFFLTGGLHLDGLADTMDGMASGRTGKAMLEIMKDSRSGAIGVVSVAVILIVRYSALASLRPAEILGGLLIAPVAGRIAMLAAMIFFGYAGNSDGLGKPFADNPKRFKFIVAVVYSLVFIWFFGGWQACIALGFALAIVMVWLLRVSRRLQGLNGDVYGASSELTETVYLVLYIACIGVGRLFA